MSVFALARRLLMISAVFMIGGIAISVMTSDAWLIVGHVAGAVSAIIAALAVMAFAIAGLHRVAADRPLTSGQSATIASHEQGLTGLEPAADPTTSSAMDGP